MGVFRGSEEEGCPGGQTPLALLDGLRLRLLSGRRALQPACASEEPAGGSFGSLMA